MWLAPTNNAFTVNSDVISNFHVQMLLQFLNANKERDIVDLKPHKTFSLLTLVKLSVWQLAVKQLNLLHCLSHGPESIGNKNIYRIPFWKNQANT